MRARPAPQRTRPANEPYHSALDVQKALTADRRVRSLARLVLLEVSRYSNGCAGACWASVATLAHNVMSSERTVQRCLRELVALGWLLELREVGRSTVYRVSSSTVARARAGELGTVELEVVPPAEELAQLELFTRGVTQSQGGGDSLTPDQTTDQTISDPPLTPPSRGGIEPDSLSELEAELERLRATRARVQAMTDDEIAELSDEERSALRAELRREREVAAEIERLRALARPPEEPTTAPTLEAARVVVEALVEPLLRDLEALPPGELGAALELYRTAPVWLVDRWLEAVRGVRVAGGGVRYPVPGVPAGVRRRYVLRALRLARERWLARGGAR